jgi:hypothetical protein
MVSSSALLLCHNTVIELLVNDTHALVCTRAHGWPAPSACALSTNFSEFLCDVSATLPLSLKARVKAGGRWAATMSSNALRRSKPDALQHVSCLVLLRSPPDAFVCPLHPRPLLRSTARGSAPAANKDEIIARNKAALDARKQVCVFSDRDYTST